MVPTQGFRTDVLRSAAYYAPSLLLTVERPKPDLQEVLKTRTAPREVKVGPGPQLEHFQRRFLDAYRGRSMNSPRRSAVPFHTGANMVLLKNHGRFGDQM